MTMTTSNAKFDRILHLDQALRFTHVQMVHGCGNEVSYAADRLRLNEALDALTDDEIPAFRQYRAAMRGN
jgi:hypothetical protein